MHEAPYHLMACSQSSRWMKHSTYAGEGVVGSGHGFCVGLCVPRKQRWDLNSFYEHYIGLL